MILQQEESEMVGQIYEVQKEDTIPGDFIELIREDKVSLKINLNRSAVLGVGKMILYKTYSHVVSPSCKWKPNKQSDKFENIFSTDIVKQKN